MFLEKAFKGKNQWYLYLVSLIIVFLTMQIASLPFLLWRFWGNWEMLATHGGDIAALLKGITNFELALLLFPNAIAFFILLVCIRTMHRKKITDVATGRSRIDLKRVAYGMVVWGVLVLVMSAVQYFTADTSLLVFQFEPVKFFGMLLVVLLFIPLQVAGEEFVFRGYLMQGFALLFRNRWMPLLLTGITFGLMHAANPEVERFGFWMMMPQYIIIGLIMGYVAIKDDGLELALGMHLVNNILSAVVVTHEASALQTHALFVDTSPTISYWDSVVLLACGIVFIVACNQKYRFWGNNSLCQRIDPAPEESI